MVSNVMLRLDQSNKVKILIPPIAVESLTNHRAFGRLKHVHPKGFLPKDKMPEIPHRESGRAMVIRKAYPGLKGIWRDHEADWKKLGL